VDGGEPLRTTPFAPWPSFEADEIEAATNVLRSGKVSYWTGEEGRLFESEFATYNGTRRAIAVANGSVALELALYALEVGPADEVITTARSFIASASCCMMRGAKPVFADVDRGSQNVTAETIRWAITPRTKAIIVVHLAGWPADMDPILELAHAHNLFVIEDCAQAHGARYKGRAVGSIGDIGAFSFCQDKIMSTGGEGGMVTTNSEELWLRAWAFKDHGKSLKAAHRRDHAPGVRIHESIGTNWRLTEKQSALGRILLRKLDRRVEKRRHFAKMLTDAFAKIAPLRPAVPPEEAHHSYYKYSVFVRPEKLREGWNRDRIVSAIRAEGIPCSSWSCSEIYLENAFEGVRPEGRLPVAKELGETSLMFLVHNTLSDRDVRDTIAAAQRVMAHAGR
jgi:dTDP-4-amino-4,6-dideoxygalactose transaminase